MITPDPPRAIRYAQGANLSCRIDNSRDARLSTLSHHQIRESKAMSGVGSPLLSLAQVVGTNPNGEIVYLAATAGVAMGLHSKDLATKVLETALQKMLEEVAVQKASTTPANPDVFVPFRKNLLDVSFGTSKKFGHTSKYFREGTSEFACLCRCDETCFNGTLVSTVIDYHRLKDLISVDDWDKFFGYCTIEPADGASENDEERWGELASLDPVYQSKRVFRVNQASVGLGAGGVLWFTEKSEVDRVLRNSPENERADNLRDVLGLFFPKYNLGTDRKARAENRRFVLHIPVDAVKTAKHARPTFIEAAGYSRFMVCSAATGRPPSSPWGQTTDLAFLEKSGQLKDGLPERVVVRRSARDLKDLEIAFDYLGEIGSSRGQRANDDDLAFAQALRGQLQNKFPAEASQWPNLQSLLSAQGVP